MKKIISYVMCLVMIPAFTTTTFALDISCNSTSSIWVGTFQSSRSGFSVSNSTFTVNSGSPTKLTVRAYDEGGYKNSDAKTYTSSSKTGGQSYWVRWDVTSMKANLNANGKITLSGTWTF